MYHFTELLVLLQKLLQFQQTTFLTRPCQFVIVWTSLLSLLQQTAHERQTQCTDRSNFYCSTTESIKRHRGTISSVQNMHVFVSPVLGLPAIAQPTYIYFVSWHNRVPLIWHDLIAGRGKNTHRYYVVQAKDASTGGEPPPQPDSVTPPRTCTRFGTGVLPIVTQSLMSSMPVLTTGSDQPVSATNPGMSQSTTLQPFGRDVHRSPLQSEDTGQQPHPSQSTEAGSQSLGKVQFEAASQSMENSKLTVDNAAMAVGLADAQLVDGSALEQHVWGAMLTQSHETRLVAADDRMKAMPLLSTKKKHGAERAVTPQTLHK